jgi:serine/threonine-protein kinase
MFLAEARLSARLNHPNVVQVSEVIESARGIMLVMEYLDGLSLRAIYAAAHDEFSLPMRLRVICDALAGLHYAHELSDYDGSALGIVHRDVTPQNVFVTYDGCVKLLDFGIAKVTSSSDDATRAGVVKGKVGYMPLEQLMNAKLDRRVDIHAVGCVLWEAVANGRMWPTQDRSQIIRSILRGEMPALSSRVKVDPEIDRIVTKAMAREPGDRYSTAEEMRLDIEGYLRSSPPITLHDIAGLLRRVCSDARSQRQRSIAEAIAKVEPGSGLHEPPPGETVTSDGVNAFLPSLLPPIENSWHAKFGVALIAVLAIGLWVLAAQKPKPILPATPSLALTEGGKCTLTVRVVPPYARVSVDEQPLESNPAVVTVAPGSEHLLRVVASGYQSRERRIHVNEDTTVMVDLRPEVTLPEISSPPNAPPEPRRRGNSDRLPETPAKAAPPRAPVEKKCNPPYYFSGGIKTYRPECI